MATETLTYSDRAAVSDVAAQDERLRQDAERYLDFKTECADIEKHSVRGANLGRELGQSFEEYYLPAKKELAQSWFNSHYSKTLRMSFEVFTWFTAIARRLPEKSKCMADVMPALQQTLFAGELIELPERTEEQVSHDTTPSTFFFKTLRGLKTVQKRLADAPSWDNQTRLAIVDEIDRAEKFLAEARVKVMA